MKDVEEEDDLELTLATQAFRWQTKTRTELSTELSSGLFKFKAINLQTEKKSRIVLHVVVISTLHC